VAILWYQVFSLTVMSVIVIMVGTFAVIDALYSNPKKYETTRNLTF